MLSAYLVGPIKGLTYGESTDWRQFAIDQLDGVYRCYSPMRGKDYLKDKGPLLGTGGTGAFEEYPMSSTKGIFRRDTWDVRRADVLLCNLLGATAISVGSVMEIQRGYDFDKYVLTVMEPGNIHFHPFVAEASSLIVPTLEYALDVMKVLASERQ